MKRRDFVVGAGVFVAGPALAQTAEPAGVPVVGPPPVKVTITTTEGPITLDLYPDKAPITVANFLRYVDNKRYDGGTFYRASHPESTTAYGVVQGGVKDRSKLFPPIKHEPTTQTGLSHKDGTISLGRNAPGTATSEFFICVDEQKYLDAAPGAPGDNLGYSAFGQVAEGMDIVRRILAMPVSPTKGPMVGQMLEKPIAIVSLRRAV